MRRGIASCGGEKRCGSEASAERQPGDDSDDAAVEGVPGRTVGRDRACDRPDECGSGSDRKRDAAACTRRAERSRGRGRRPRGAARRPPSTPLPRLRPNAQRHRAPARSRRFPRAAVQPAGTSRRAACQASYATAMPTPAAIPTSRGALPRPRSANVASTRPASARRPEGFARTVAAAPSAASGIASRSPEALRTGTTAVAAEAAATGTSVIPAAANDARTEEVRSTPTASGGKTSRTARSDESCRASCQTAATRTAANAGREQPADPLAFGDVAPEGALAARRRAVVDTFSASRPGPDVAGLGDRARPRAERQRVPQPVGHDDGDERRRESEDHHHRDREPAHYPDDPLRRGHRAGR